MRRLLAMLVALPLLTACAGPAPSGPSYTGHWKTTWREGNASMTLVQMGDRVEGDYSYNDGGIYGTAQGRHLTGEWVETDRAGSFDVELAADGQSFIGNYATTRGGSDGGYWTGIRDE